MRVRGSTQQAPIVIQETVSIGYQSINLSENNKKNTNTMNDNILLSTSQQLSTEQLSSNKSNVVQLNPPYQLNLSYNIITIDRGLCLAPNGIQANRRIECNYLVDKLLDRFKSYAGKQRLRPEHRVALSMLLANLKHTAEQGGQLIIGRKHQTITSRNPQKITQFTTNQLLEFMAKSEGLIDYMMAGGNEYLGNSSWCIPLPLLTSKLEHAKILHIHGHYSELRKGGKGKDKKKPILWSKMATVQRQLAKIDKEMKAYNELSEHHTFTIGYKKEIIPFARRIYNKSIELGGRIYAPWQNMPKESRLQLYIDRSPTTELDYKSIHYNLLYAKLNLVLMGDPYEVEGYDRDFIKRISLRMINSKSMKVLANMITQSGKPKIIIIIERYKKECFWYAMARRRGHKATKPREPDILDAYIEDVPIGTNGQKLIDSILKRHAPIAHLFGTKDLGLRLQNKDSNIIAECLKRATEENIPVLSIHDSIICKRKDRGLIYGIMRDVYHDQTGHKIAISES